MPMEERPVEDKTPKQSEEELFESLIIEAQSIPGDNRLFDDGREIPWLDMDLAQAGQDFFQKHYTSLLLAHVLYFGLGFGFKPVTGLVFKSGGFKGIDRVMKRLLATIWHLISWYEQDILGTYSAGTKAIADTRQTHETMRRRCSRARPDMDFGRQDESGLELSDPIATALNEDLKFVDSSTLERMDLTYDPPVQMSQFSMAGTQLSFALPAIAQPLAFGIHDNEGVEAFEHLWALIGHLSGIEDRFNVPLQRPGKSFYVRFLMEVILPSLLVRDAIINTVQRSFFRSSNSYMPQLSIPATLYFFLKQSKVEGFKGTQLYRLMTLRDKITAFCLSVLLWMFRWSAVREFVNWGVRSMMHGVLAKYAKEEEAEGRQFTYLPHDVKWSHKYRKRDAAVLSKWKKTEAILDFMKVRKEKINRGVSKDKK